MNIGRLFSLASICSVIVVFVLLFSLVLDQNTPSLVSQIASILVVLLVTLFLLVAIESNVQAKLSGGFPEGICFWCRKRQAVRWQKVEDPRLEKPAHAVHHEGRCFFCRSPKSGQFEEEDSR